MVTAKPAWLGDPEGELLEYKGAAALNHPETIVRAVVAMLNHRGGVVVVGVTDGGAVEGVASPEDQRDRLQNLLLDRIKPRPLDIEVRSVSTQDKEVLEITVPRNTDRLHAEQVTRGALGFWHRSGALTIPLTYDEVHSRFLSTASTRGTKREPIPDWREGLHDRPNEIRLVLLAQSRTRQETSEYQPLEAALGRESEIIYRRGGFSVYESSPGLPPEWKRRNRRIAIGEPPAGDFLSISQRGETRFEGPRAFLVQPTHVRVPQANIIYPLALVEGTATFVRLLRVLAQETRWSADAEITLGLWQARGWSMPPGRHDSLRSQHLSMEELPRLADDAPSASTEINWDQFRADSIEATDPVALRLLEEVYDWFGYEPDQIPYWNARSKRFEFPH